MAINDLSTSKAEHSQRETWNGENTSGASLDEKLFSSAWFPEGKRIYFPEDIGKTSLKLLWNQRWWHMLNFQEVNYRQDVKQVTRRNGFAVLYRPGEAVKVQAFYKLCHIINGQVDEIIWSSMSLRVLS